MTYLIQQQHTPEQCLNAIDKLEQRGEELLGNCYFACKSGEHTAYCFMEGDSQSKAEEICSSDFGGDCQVKPVEQYSTEQIRSFHQGGKSSESGQWGMESGYGSEEVR